jgi:hypothetical protein
MDESNMQELSSYIKRINYPLFIFALLGLRFALFSSNIADSLYLVAFLGYTAYDKYLASLIKGVKTSDERIKDMEATINGMALQKQVKPTIEQSVKRYF